jgi:hypothetical protein
MRHWPPGRRRPARIEIIPMIDGSGGALLDRQAERIVAACGFPPMPAEAFPPFVGTD